MDKVQQGALMMLQGLSEKFGLDLDDENFRETPERVSKAWDEIFSGIKDTDKQVKEIFKKSFPSSYSEMVIAREIKTFSMCPHHFLPVEYTVHVAYIPEVGGQVIGISKLTRLVEILSKRPVLQEQFVEDVTQYLMQIDGASGAACVAHGRHFCMTMRGVKQPSSVTTTSSLKGIFKKPTKGLAARTEFMSLIG